LRDVLVSKIIPLLQEYFYDDWQSVCAVLNQSYQSGGGILREVEKSESLFSSEFEELLQFSNRKIFEIREEFLKGETLENAIREIYEI
jgi:hypothetical protein